MATIEIFFYRGDTITTGLIDGYFDIGGGPFPVLFKTLPKVGDYNPQYGYIDHVGTYQGKMVARFHPGKDKHGNLKNTD